MANSLAHTKWVCKYHIVFTPKYRRKIIYHQLRKDIQQIIKDLCKWKGVEIIDADYKANRIDYSMVNDTENPFSQLSDVYKALDYVGINYYRNNQLRSR